MPRASWCRPEIYAFFDRWRRTCLIEDGAMFGPGNVWTDANLAAVHTILEGTDKRGFISDFAARLEPHPPLVRRLGGELVYVEQLGEDDTSAERKRHNLAL